MNKILIVITVFGLILLASCTPKPIAGEKAENPAVNTEGLSSISIPDQKIFENVVFISEAIFDKPGFIVVTKTTGEIVGNSQIYLAGTYTDIGVKIDNYEGASSLSTFILYDDGDNTFEYPGNDVIAKNGGSEVKVSFNLE